MKFKRIVFFFNGTNGYRKKFIFNGSKKKFSNIELLSVDSKLVYKELNIGTDKPTEKQLFETPYRLINIKNIYENYSAADFCIDAYKEIKHIFSLKKIPFFVGGSMLYFKALLDGLVTLPTSNQKIRDYIFNNLFCADKNKLFNGLKQVDFASSSKIHINDVQRVIRALEVFFVSGGVPLSKLLTLSQKKLPYQVFQFALIPYNKKKLYNKISVRFQKMLNNGLEEEVRNLYTQISRKNTFPFMNSIGYKQMWEYLEKKCTYQEMICNTLQATRKLVKHQLTWLRKWKNINLIYDNNKDILMKKIKKSFITKNNTFINLKFIINN
ncbi:delta(2)-isopentenylpyrophosphate tRNA-adenosine transferase [Buchnera aphidicola (Cinara tujafilina)]|uniref:tRNA dimethylallyltransferase n=1 Tax=Buchnera aphidicola (Cinara tujafilina) TaxID=261317 RepID=F7WZR5_9GAMM|nr:tRNA (adenosine(37)-N6)-dimethylallyltransferase MiaA [Buchnera aphidicola]AEH39941.1 delta(2)-isopentenylpyrophosphate tRNA-adenosine transferase [Buchnera aphidicola (Cinara tujafilina)]